MDIKCYHIAQGPFKKELFAALGRYPKKKVTFEIALSQVCDYNLLGEKTLLAYLCCTFDMFVHRIEAVLMPCLKEPITIDMMKDTWQVEGFIQQRQTGLFYQLELLYNTRNRTGSMFLPKEGR